MKKIIFLLLIISDFLISANLLTHSIYNRQNRVDLMLTFDEPYHGRISQREFDNNKIIKLYNLSFAKEVKESIDSKILKEIDIFPRKNSLYIFLKSDKKIFVTVDKTVDNYGLRIRASFKMLKKEETKKEKPTPVVSPVKKDKQNDNKISLGKKEPIVKIGYGYYIFLSLLILIAILLYLFRERLQNRQGGTWLFKNRDGKKEKIAVKYQKVIDSKNRVILVEHKNTSYLILVGNTNILLDKFSKDNVKKEEEFEDIFEKNRQRLDEFLKVNDKKFQDYKTKVSKDIEDLIEEKI